MSLIADIAAWSVLALGLVLFTAQMVAREVGFWFGRRAAARDAAAGEGVGTVVGAILALLAFVLAITLSYASTRFSERREGTLMEANAIGTAWLRAEAIGHPRGAEIARLLRDYVRNSAAFVTTPPDPAPIAAIIARGGALQTEIWGHATALVRERPDPAVTSLLAALNETFDATTAQRFAFAIVFPAQLFWLLVVMAVVGMAGLGYQLGLRGNPLRILAATLTALWTLVMIDILDLGSARLGAFRTSPAVYQWTEQGMSGGGVVIPPLPQAR